MSKIALEGNASGTGTLTIAAPNTNTDYSLTLPTESGTILTNSGSGAASFATLTVAGSNISAANSMGFRNRIINGDMRIDQRNAGAAVTVDGAAPYTLDRWQAQDSTDGAYTIQQVSTAPAGFVNSLKFTTTTADASLGATQQAWIRQAIEGTSVPDLAWGSADAKTVTLSFWVRSSITGTFGGCVSNSAENRSYPFTYSISAADTWEQKSVTIAGDTSGTWLTTTGVGMRLYFGLGVGSTYSGTAGSWAGATYLTATGAASVIGTLNATWYITGVQLEVGSVATEFERRPYGTELALCQRYCVVFRADGSTGGYSRLGGAGLTTGGVGSNYNYSPSVPFRAVPSFTAVGGTGSMRVWNGTTLYTVSSFSVTADSTNTVINYDVVSGGGQTSNDPVQLLYYNTTSSSLNTVLSAEL